MDYSASFSISAAGMSVERARVDVTAMNLANANTVAGQDGAIYRPLRVVAQPAGMVTTAFSSAVDTGLQVQKLLAALPLPVVEISDVAPRMVHDPGHPLADPQGFVAYANVDPATEMVELMGATRAYEANVAAMNAARTMALKALDIGGNA